MANPIEHLKGIPDETAVIAIASTELGYKAYAMSNIKDFKNIATMAVCRAVMELLDKDGLELYDSGINLLKADLKAKGIEARDGVLTMEQARDLYGNETAWSEELPAN